MVGQASITTIQLHIDTPQKQDFKYEYISLRMEMPTEKAELDISFPKGYPVDFFPGVFFGESESMHDYFAQKSFYRIAD
jgi:hypothetical protein